ncbi:hypothetical protein BN1723_005773, partial [Verticillium longisporum]
MAGFNDAPIIQKLAVPGVTLLILFLGYSSQYLFLTAADLAPGPLTSSQLYTFNGLLLCLWFTYYKACTVDPGRYIFTSKTHEVPDDDNDNGDKTNSSHDDNLNSYARWCRKCEAPKPPRAHHCRTCRRCIPKMDHHCPWTTNCVSLTTLPHFLRFLVYTNLALAYLSYLLFLRFAALWSDRRLPAYLGPSLPALTHLACLAGVDFLTSVALGIMLATTTYHWLFNMTTIESWEADRHDDLVANRGGRAWWDAGRAPYQRVEFPYDLGLFANLAHAMGTRNPLLWLAPWAAGPSVSPVEGQGPGWTYEENGFNAREGMWPPPDPSKMRGRGAWPAARAALDREGQGPRYATPAEDMAAFRRRQEADLRRWQGSRAEIMDELEEREEYDMLDGDAEDGVRLNDAAGGAAWTNSDGERLYDYGVDEDAENTELDLRHTIVGEADDDVPLAELLRRRKVRQKDGEE